LRTTSSVGRGAVRAASCLFVPDCVVSSAGFCSGNTKAIADTLADAGFFVVTPDIVAGDSVENHGGLTPDGFAWVAANMSMAAARPALEAAFELVGSRTIGMAGFCWGVWCVALRAAVPFPPPPGRATVFCCRRPLFTMLSPTVSWFCSCDAASIPRVHCVPSCVAVKSCVVV
jgi:dienelactone hydrolase